YLWSILYLLFALLCGYVTFFMFRKNLAALPQAVSAQTISWRECGIWIALSALPAALLVATTNELTQAITPMPFLWILPLALYLLAFVVAFSGLGSVGWSAAFAFLSAAIAYSYFDGSYDNLTQKLGAALLFLFLMSLYCNIQ